MNGSAAQTCGQTFERFVAAINHHDVLALASLMTPDHLFVDSLGNRMQGAGSMSTGWSAYFAICPDYWIRVRDQLLGKTSCWPLEKQAAPSTTSLCEPTRPGGPSFATGSFSEWQVFADNKPVYEILARRAR